MPDKMIMSTLF